MSARDSRLTLMKFESNQESGCGSLKVQVRIVLHVLTGIVVVLEVARIKFYVSHDCVPAFCQ